MEGPPLNGHSCTVATENLEKLRPLFFIKETLLSVALSLTDSNSYITKESWERLTLIKPPQLQLQKEPETANYSPAAVVNARSGRIQADFHPAWACCSTQPFEWEQCTQSYSGNPPGRQYRLVIPTATLLIKHWCYFPLLLGFSLIPYTSLDLMRPAYMITDKIQ